MRITNKFHRKVWESIGFVFSPMGKGWACDEISKRAGYGPRQSYTYLEYEIILTDTEDKEGQWYYQKFYSGKEVLKGHTNSYREAILLTFGGIRRDTKSTYTRYDLAKEK